MLLDLRIMKQHHFETSKQINNNGFICTNEDYKITVKNKNKNFDFAKKAIHQFNKKLEQKY